MSIRSRLIVIVALAAALMIGAVAMIAQLSSSGEQAQLESAEAGTAEVAEALSAYYGARTGADASTTLISPSDNLLFWSQ